MGSPDGVNPNTTKYVKISLVRFKIRDGLQTFRMASSTVIANMYL